MKLIFAKDCDCDAYNKIGVVPCTIAYHKTDELAMKAFIDLYIRYNGMESSQHGPSGHFLKVIGHNKYNDIPVLPPRTAWDMVVLDKKPPRPAVCHGQDDPCCGHCRFSTHGCAEAVPE